MNSSIWNATNGIMGLRPETDFEGWRDVDQIVECAETIAERVNLALSALRLNWGPDGARVDHVYWPFRIAVWSERARGRELLAFWYLPDEAEQLAETLDKGRIVAETGNHYRAAGMASKSADGQYMAALVEQIDDLPSAAGIDQPIFRNLGRLKKLELLHRVDQRRRLADANHIPGALTYECEEGFDEAFYVNVQLPKTYRWPKLNDLGGGDLVGSVRACATLIDEKYRLFLSPEVDDRLGHRRFDIPPEELPYGGSQPRYPERIYAGETVDRVLELECREGVRLRNGNNPLWFLDLYRRFLNDRPSGRTFAAYCRQGHSRHVEVIQDGKRTVEKVTDKDEGNPSIMKQRFDFESQYYNKNPEHESNRQKHAADMRRSYATKNSDDKSASARGFENARKWALLQQPKPQ